MNSARRVLGVFSVLAAISLASVTGAVTPAPGLLEPSPVETLADMQSRIRQHVFTLSNPFFEGRAPGTRGNLLAADYLESVFKTAGLVPAFTDEKGKPTYRQPFKRGEEVGAGVQEASYAVNGVNTTLTPGTDFNVLNCSDTASVTAPLAFCGYSISAGKDSYGTYDQTDDLKGKIAIVLRFEPMNDDGTSKWAEQGWSFYAGLEPKLGAAIKREAAGVIVACPPGAKDERCGKMEDVKSRVTSGQPYKGVPVVFMSVDALDALVKSADAQGRSLLDLRKIADAGGSVIDLPNASVTLNVGVERKPIMTDNVGAILPGSGPLKDEYVVLGAHYDHVGYGYFGSRDPQPMGKLHPGADDNASGTSGLLTLAQRMGTYAKNNTLGDGPRRSVLFLGFSAEESGLHGSRHYVQHPVAPLKTHSIMLNMDMIGRLRDNKLEVGGTGTAVGLSEWCADYFTASGLVVAGKPGGGGPSDHASFNQAGVPVLFFFTGLHDEYHTPQDVADTINVDGATHVADMVGRMALDAATQPEIFVPTQKPEGSPGDQPSPGPTRGNGVRFGIAPGDYSGEDGVMIGEVFPNTPAAKAGLQKDDRITKWNGESVRSVEDWMPLFSAAKPGDVVKVTFVRKDEEQTVDVTLEARRRQGPQ